MINIGNIKNIFKSDDKTYDKLLEMRESVTHIMPKPRITSLWEMLMKTDWEMDNDIAIGNIRESVMKNLNTHIKENKHDK